MDISRTMGRLIRERKIRVGATPKGRKQLFDGRRVFGTLVGLSFQHSTPMVIVRLDGRTSAERYHPDYWRVVSVRGGA